MTQHFLSHLYLGENSPRHNFLFMKYLAEHMGQIDALYLLGNVFDAWTGDSSRHHVTEELVGALAVFTTQTPIFMQRGSRDFLIGNKFAKRTGITMLPDVAFINHGDKNILLLHGHEFYHHDPEYLTLRCQLINLQNQDSLILNPTEQKKIAQQIRQTDQLKHVHHNFNALKTTLEEYGTKLACVNTIIHGYVDSTLTESSIFDEQNIKRYVIPHWQQSNGEYLVLSGQY